MRTTPAAGVLRIGAANVYQGNPAMARALALARGANFHSWGWSEGDGLVRHLPKRGHSRYVSLTANEGMRAPRMLDVNDCFMQAARTLNIVHFSMTKACEEIPGNKIAHQRTFSMLAYKADRVRKGMVVCHIAIHPNWVVGLNKGPVVDRYVDSLAVLGKMIQFAKTQGWAVVVSGDFNTLQNQKKPFRTCYDVFRYHKLKVRTVSIDGFAWDASKLSLTGWHTVPERVTKADHPWLIAEFKKPTKKKLRAFLSRSSVVETVEESVVELKEAKD